MNERHGAMAHERYFVSRKVNFSLHYNPSISYGRTLLSSKTTLIYAFGDKKKIGNPLYGEAGDLSVVKNSTSNKLPLDPLQKKKKEGKFV